MGVVACGAVVKMAKSQVGYKAPGPGKKNKYAAYIDSHYPKFYNGKKNGATVDWCDIFVDWCVLQVARDAKKAEYVLCQPEKSCGAGVGWSWKYYKAKKRTTKTAKTGYQIFLNDLKHTGIVTNTDSKYVWYVAGNEGGGHGQVKSHKILKTSKTIYGYGRPRYG